MAGLDRIAGNSIPPDMNGVPRPVGSNLRCTPRNRLYSRHVYTKAGEKSRGNVDFSGRFARV